MRNESSYPQRLYPHPPPPAIYFTIYEDRYDLKERGKRRRKREIYCSPLFQRRARRGISMIRRQVYRGGRGDW